MSQKIYVICNSHMDPIWKWRLREGRSTWMNTCRCVANMLDKYPFLHFSRSSSACYRWIEATDLELFRRIAAFVEAGRWEPVGGWVEQSDTIVTPGESLLRQAEYGKAYFQQKFGYDVKVAYSVDSFGQNAGLPKLLQTSGFDYYAWMRPMAHEKTMPDSFRWKCDDDSGDIVSFRIRQAYCTPMGFKSYEDLVAWVERATACDEYSVPVLFFGVGDHGGGIYENLLQMLLKFGEQHELEFCNLETYFHVLEKKKLPLLKGEHTHHSPGCYSAVHGVKEWMADAEKNLRKAEKIVLQTRFSDAGEDVAHLNAAWEDLLFYHFHDVYSGTCTRASYEHEIRDGIGADNACAVNVIEKNLCRIAASMKTDDFLKEGGLMLWNPLSCPVRGIASLETFQDPNRVGSPFNCIRTREGKEFPLQWLPGDTAFGAEAVVTADLEPSSTACFAYGRTQKTYHKLGFDTSMALLKRLSFCVLADKGDTWGHALVRLGEDLGCASLCEVIPMEDGPVVSHLRAKYEWQHSTIQLDLYQYAGIAPVKAVFHAFWAEDRQTVKACFADDTVIDGTASGQASTILYRATDDHEQPFLDWVATGNAQNRLAFLANSLHGYDVKDNLLRLTVLRPVYYCEHNPMPAHGDEGHDGLGEQVRTFWLFKGKASDSACAQLAQERLWGAEHLEITASPGKQDFQLLKLTVKPASVVAQAERLDTDGKIFSRLLNTANKAVTAQIFCDGKLAFTSHLKPGELSSVRF